MTTPTNQFPGGDQTPTRPQRHRPGSGATPPFHRTPPPGEHPKFPTGPDRGPGGIAGPGRGTHPTGPDDPTAGLSGDERDAYVALMSMFQGYGLETLAPKILEYAKQGYDTSTMQYLLQQTDEWKQRFAGNELRKKNGQNVLSVSDYLNTEDSMREVMKRAGLPATFYDTNDDFAQWIGAGVSAQEVQSRAQTAMSFALNADPNSRQALKDFYGIDDAHLAAFFLDPKAAEPILQRQANAAMLGAAALDQGLSTTAARAQQFADPNMSADQQLAQGRQGYATIAGLLPDESAIAARFGTDYTQADAEDEVFGGLASANRKRQQLNQQEQQLFAGNGGAGSDFYHPDYALQQRTSGQF